MQARAQKQEVSLDIKKKRLLVVFVTIASIVVANSLVLISGSEEERNLVGNIIRPLTAALAVAFSLKVVYKQKLDGLFGKAYASLAVGLVLWFAAEIIWGYYSFISGVELPFPSLADAIWLVGYGPLGFHLFTTAKLYRAFKNGSTRIFIVATAVTIFSTVLISQIVTASHGAASSSALSLAISITYPIADAILIIPAVLSIAKSGRGELTAIPWIFISLVFTVIADAILGYTIDTNNTSQTSTICNLFYNTSYLFMAAGLYWHGKYFVIDVAKIESMWRKDNR